jgi:hypothetical protein
MFNELPFFAVYRAGERWQLLAPALDPRLPVIFRLAVRDQRASNVLPRSWPAISLNFSMLTHEKVCCFSRKTREFCVDELRR